MKIKKHIIGGLVLLMALFSMSLPSMASSGEEQQKIDVQEIVMGHTGDSHEWHLFTLNGHHVSIPLPVIVLSNDGAWHCFMSSEFHESEGGVYNGFFIPQEGDNKDKVCEMVNGEQTRVRLDLSLTKDVIQMWIVVGLMLIIFIGSARWYKNKKAEDSAPKGFVGLVEMFVMMIHDDVIKTCVGEEHYKRYAPYLLTAFFFIFLSNLMGLIPFFPGGANLTGNIAITFVLAMCTFLAINLFGNKEYWLDIFWPKVPAWLKVPVPMMPVIELFGIFTKPFALMVRLFANIFAGHAIVLSLTCVIFISCQLGAAIGAGLSGVSVIMIIFMDCLELLVAFIQAYVFTMLSAIFIGLAHPKEEHE